MLGPGRAMLSLDGTAASLVGGCTGGTDADLDLLPCYVAPRDLDGIDEGMKR